MRFLKQTLALSLILNLTACALTPEQSAEREARRVREAQALQVALAKQCDAETAELMYEQFNPPVSQTAKEEAAFKKRYIQKVNDPMFQACYKMATENYKAQVELEEMRRDYYHHRPMFYHPWYPCYYCW